MTWQEISSVFGDGSEFVVVAAADDAAVVPFVFAGVREAEPLHEGNFAAEYERQQLRVVNPDWCFASFLCSFVFALGMHAEDLEDSLMLVDCEAEEALTGFATRPRWQRNYWCWYLHLEVGLV